MMTAVTKDDFLRAATSGDVDTVRGYFQQPHVAAAAAQIEAEIAEAGREALRPSSYRHVVLRRNLLRQDAWFYRPHRALAWKSFYKVHGARLYGTLEWLYYESSGMPLTLAYLAFGLIRHAASRGRAAALELLLTSRTFQEVMTDNERSSALAEAVRGLLKKRLGGSGTIDALEVLVAHGGDVADAFNHLWRGSVRMLEWLVDNGAVVIRSTPLRTAAWFGESDERIQSLLSHGAHFNNSGDRFLVAKAAGACIGTMKSILEKTCVDIDMHDLNGTSLLMAAIGGVSPTQGQYPSDGRIELVDYLLKHDIEIDKTNERGETALTVAVKVASVHILEALLQHGADPNIPDKDGCTSLHCVADSGDLQGEMTRLLLDYGADPTIKCSDGRTPLHLLSRVHVRTGGAESSIAQAVTHLILHGADPNAVDTIAGRTPVHKCVQIFQSRINVSVLEALTGHGGELFYSDANGVTAYDLLRQHEDGRSWLERRGFCDD